jgi:HEAT repeat protein
MKRSLVLLIFLVALGCSRGPEQEWVAAETAYEEGQYQRALALAESAFERHPDAPAARRVLILSSAATGDVGRGMTLLESITPPESATPLWREFCLAVIAHSFQNENLFVRSAAVKAIGEMGDRTQIQRLIPALKDQETFVRFFAVEALGQLKGEEAIQLLMAAGSDPDPMVRIAAVKTLDEMDAPARLFPFFEGDTEATVKLFALAGQARREGAEKAAQQTAAAKLMALAEARPDDPAVPAAFSRAKIKTAVPHLLRTLTHQEAQMRMYAAEALGDIADPSATPLLLTALKDDDASVRAAAATALGKLGDAKATGPLTETLKEADLRVRLSAAEGLFYLGQIDWAPYAEALRHEDYGIRHAAIGSLRKIAKKGNPQALEMLIAQRADAAPRVRIAVVRAIGETGNGATVPVLKELLKDEDLAVRTYAAGNLARLLKLPS